MRFLLLMRTIAQRHGHCGIFYLLLWIFATAGNFSSLCLTLVSKLIVFLKQVVKLNYPQFFSIFVCFYNELSLFKKIRCSYVLKIKEKIMFSSRRFFSCWSMTPLVMRPYRTFSNQNRTKKNKHTKNRFKCIFLRVSLCRRL